ncbi:MAG: class I SAM-dependent methyltransferase [Bacteroidota bacterium]|nr:class I SAM-dependent methyltransferase [Bacteroidota bacterium]
MFEIYEKHSREYDDLVKHEDYENNLGTTLAKILEGNDLKIVEAGVGTGRITRLYINRAKHIWCFDRSRHMIERAKINLADYLDKITFQILDNRDINKFKGKADYFIEGWSFGHTIIENQDNINKIVKKLISNCIKICSKKIIIIETLGTNVNEPVPTNEVLFEFYKILEEEYNFEKKIVRTDYKFESNEEAERIMGFFFGEKMKDSLLKTPRSIIPEWTGVWVKDLNHQNG